MKEYWVNVYSLPINQVQYGNCFSSKSEAIMVALKSAGDAFKLLYRIHVRLK